MLIPTFPDASIRIIVGVEVPLLNLKSILDPLVLCWITPCSPSTPRLNCPPVPITTPSLFFTFKSKFDVELTSVLTKFAAGTVVFPITNASAFSAVP